ncbi:MAG: hypothetical protein N2515_09325, partial [Deltaproteobacteria bacterium]|nr:hypothetical protein [Deltaproteobacteria bacterium]
ALVAVVSSGVAFGTCILFDQKEGQEDECHFKARIVANVTGPALDDVVWLGPQSTAFVWSESQGTFIQEIERSPKRSLPFRCEIGLALAGDELICGAKEQGKGGRIWAIHKVGSVNALQLELVADGVGPQSRGIDAARIGERRIVAWRSGDRSDSAIWMADGRKPPSRLSGLGTMVSRPSVLLDRNAKAMVAWSEGWFDGNALRASLRLWRDGEALKLEPLSILEAQPELAALPNGAVALVFRDERIPKERPHAILRILDQGLAFAPEDGPPCNAKGEALVVPCFGAIGVVAPRTHSRAERVVGVRFYHPHTLKPITRPRSLYVHGLALEHVDARCQGDVLELIAASAPTVKRSTGAIVYATMRCPHLGVLP